jgi:hypothetical protein
VKRTGAGVVVLVVVLGLVLGILTQTALASAGRPGVTPPVSLALVLGLIGVIVVVLAVPIRRSVKGTRTRVDPFYALRVVVLAKASALTGGLIVGVGVGFVVYLLSRTVPALGSIGYSIGMTMGAVVLLIAGLVAESMCRVPPPGDDENDSTAAGALP